MAKKRSGRKRFRPTIRLTVVTIFVLATVLTAALAVGLQYYFSRSMATTTAISRFDGLAASTGEFLNGVDQQAIQATRLLASYPGLISGRGDNDQVRDLFAEFMNANGMFYAIYLGFDDNSFYELINLNSGRAVRQQLKALPQDRWVLVTVADQIKTTAYYDRDFTLRTQHRVPSDYYATSRPWFVQAEEGVVNKTAPYLFQILQEPGQTYSIRLKGGGAVIAVDIALSSLSRYLSSQRVHGEGDIYLYRKNGEVIASDLAAQRRRNLPPAKPLTLSEQEQAVIAAAGTLKVSNETDWPPIDFAVSGQPNGYSIDYLTLISQQTGLQFEYVNGFTWLELLERFRNGEIDLLQSTFLTPETQELGFFTAPFLTLPYSLVTRPGNARVTHIRQMNGKTLAIPRGWSIIKVIRQHFPQITVIEVDSTRDVLQAVKQGQADAGLDVGEILHHTAQQYFFTALQYHDAIQFDPVDFPQQLHVVVSPRHAELVPIFNRAIAAVTDTQKAALAAKWFDDALQDTLGIVPYPELLQLADAPDLQRRLNRRVIDGEDCFVYVTPFDQQPDWQEFLAIVMPVDAVLKPALEKVTWSVLFTAGLLLILLPTPWIFASPIVAPINALAHESEKIRLRHYDQLRIPDSHIKEVHDLGVSMKIMAGSIREHEANQKALMDAFIQLIAQAIDEKSPYTGGHCRRVPELAFMLVKEAENSTLPPFKSFAFSSEEQWREFRVGAWLHDCGKITTPEHIVDKGSKLELIYNRIHEIRTRFEVLWRDAEIAYWQQRSLTPAAQSRLQQELAEKQRQLLDDFAFVASMNVGGEFLDEDKKQRLLQLAEVTWTRHFSDRLGLSPHEEGRLDSEEAALPCTEFLLVDKPEHRIRRDQQVGYDAHLGIRMDIPEDRANRGEVHNLLIERGTLTAEDRFKINEHIISTIRMLDALPFPKELSNVPRYASTHHETMAGNGYPRRLKGEELSVPERVMVLADIFEALTAADRPYKKAKPLSAAIAILHSMVEQNHIDRDVFNLFLLSGVYLDYARRFLPEEQIDAVDIRQYVQNDEA
jgi:HD-GYP domain-containing protein (c-di-GMP phosphodiesterase class II)/ABC-type amino acid transport substrate-binding protein